MDARFQRRIQRYGWDKAAALYEGFWHEQLEPAQTRLLEMAEPKPGEFVLDTACGTGLVTFRVAETVLPRGNVVGTDISEVMVTRARSLAASRQIENTSFERMDGEDLHLPDNSFDVALSALGLLYYPDPLRGLREMYRVLKPGGRAVAAVWGQRDRCGWAEVFPIVDAQVRSEVCPLFFQLGTADLLANAFKEAGFRRVAGVRLASTLRYDTPEAACGAAFAGGPVALAYSRFDEQVQETVHRQYLASIESFKNAHGYMIPGEFVIVSGHKQA